MKYVLLIKEFLRYAKLAKELIDSEDLNFTNKAKLAQGDKDLETTLYNISKVRLAQKVLDGEVSREYAVGFLNAIDYRRGLINIYKKNTNEVNFISE